MTPRRATRRSTPKRWIVAFGLCLAIATHYTPGAYADEPVLRGIPVDRTLVRFRDRDESKVHFIFERELAFEARLEALSLGEPAGARVTERHLRLALTRHITEVLLAELPTDPPPSPEEVGERAEAARQNLEARVGGEERLREALVAEAFDHDELDRLLRRTARASLYLDRMVAPIAEPTDVELREFHALGKSPFSDLPFQEIRGTLKRWMIAKRLSAALTDFWNGRRARLVIEVLAPRGGASKRATNNFKTR